MPGGARRAAARGRWGGPCVAPLAALLAACALIAPVTRPVAAAEGPSAVNCEAKRCTLWFNGIHEGRSVRARAAKGAAGDGECACMLHDPAGKCAGLSCAYDDLKKNGWKVPANRDKAAYMLNQNEQDECQCLGPCEAGSEYCGHAIFYEDVPPKEDKKGSSKNAKSEL